MSSVIESRGAGPTGDAAGTDDKPWPRFASDEAAGEFRARDPRVFRADRRGFCRLWLDAAVRQAGVRLARVDLATSTALLAFEPGASSASASASVSASTMAAAFAGAVREALAVGEDRADGRADWVALTAFPGADSPAWEVVERSSGRLRLRHPGLVGDRQRRADWLDRLAGTLGVTACRAGRGWSSDALTIGFDPSLTDEPRILDAAQLAWLESGRAWLATGPGCPFDDVAVGRWARGVNLAKAGGAFVLTLVGLAVPGIPTFPFLLATSYYLARSSPRLNRAFLDSAFFGPILRDWETHRGLSPSSKGKLVGLTAVILAVTIVVSAGSPLVLALILVISPLGIYQVLRLPGVPPRQEDGPPDAPALAPAPG